MDRSKTIYLIAETFAPDEYHVMRSTKTEHKVYCQVDSVSLSEWSEGGRYGLNPEYRMRMFAPEYKGEQLLKYNGDIYQIYRTYRGRNNTIDLYVQRRQGNVEQGGNDGT
jgi:hypothetical protein